MCIWVDSKLEPNFWEFLSLVCNLCVAGLFGGGSESADVGRPCDQLNVFESNYDYTTQATMSLQNIIVFGDPAIDTRFVVKLAGASYMSPFDPLRSVFKTDCYLSNQRYWLYHTVGLPSSRTGRSSLQAPDVLRNLHSFIHIFDVGVNLLIYVVRADKPTSSNFRLFYDYLCQQDTPIILVQTTHTPSELSCFNLVLTLDGADPKSDKVNNLHKAIVKHLKKAPKVICFIDQSESTARGC